MYYGDKLCSCQRVTHAVSSCFLRIIYNFASKALTKFTSAKTTVPFMCFSVIVFKIERLKVKKWHIGTGSAEVPDESETETPRHVTAGDVAGSNYFIAITRSAASGRLSVSQSCCRPCLSDLVPPPVPLQYLFSESLTPALHNLERTLFFVSKISCCSLFPLLHCFSSQCRKVTRRAN